MLIRCLIILALLLTGGCSGEGDIKRVDFSDVVDVERPSIASSKQQVLRVAVGAMVSPRDTFVHYREILDHIGSRIGREVQLIQRKTYNEINHLLGRGDIDLAFICSGPYVTSRESYGFELLAAPEIHGSHFYRAYLIVNENSPYSKLEDLSGKSFAFTDPESNTGKLVPVHWLSQINQKPETFFGHTIYTYSHDNSIMAVAKDMVDGASVDGLVWEYFHARHPSLTSKTRVIKKSSEYGIPPLVVSRHLSRELKERVENVLFSMHQDVTGRKILDKLMIDRFVKPDDAWYDGVRQIHSVQPQISKDSHDLEKP